MPHSEIHSQEFAVCVQNGDYKASLEARKLYAVVEDADAAKMNLIRVVDESGEDYLYPASMFRRLALPLDVERDLRLAS